MNKPLLVLISTIPSLVAGFVAGRLSVKKPKPLKVIGNLRIDNSDDDNPNALFLELKVPVSYIYQEKIVHLKVVKQDYLRK